MNETIQKLYSEIRGIERDRLIFHRKKFVDKYYGRLQEIDTILSKITFEVGHSEELDQCKTKVFNMIDFIEDGE